MGVITEMQGIGRTFVAQMDGVFLSENSRLWWGWIIVTFPLIGAIVGSLELKREGKPVTLANLFKFIFPSHIYKSHSFAKDCIIVATLYLFYTVVLFFVTGLDAKFLIGKSIGVFGAALDGAHLTDYKKLLPANLGVHLFFTFVVIVAYDFGFTMSHYAFHKIPFLWKFHRVHHSAEHLTPLTVARFHLVEYTVFKAIEGISIGAIFGLFYYFLPHGLDLYKIFGLSIFGILFSSIGVFRHSHIWISYGWMSYIFCSPAMHQIHHSKEERHLDKNMSQIFSFWDYLLGTLYIPKERETFAVGLAHEPDYNKQGLRKSLAIHLKP
jgi:sterol desaturase/sphingolipid hydroxylase (fatty acid hydroxylase superfamily)